MRMPVFTLETGVRPCPGAADTTGVGSLGFRKAVRGLDVAAPEDGRTPQSSAAAFTVLELLVAGAVGLLIMAGTMTFMYFSSLSVSGISSQATLNQQAGNAIEFIQSRVRYATMVSNGPAGNTLTLGFDDNPAADSNGDGISYNDKDHYERFKFIGVNGSASIVASNRLVYLSNIASTAQKVLIPNGVRNLPGFNIFTVTNGATVIVRFGVVDTYARDHYQSIDIQATAVPLNRPAATNFVGILP